MKPQTNDPEDGLKRDYRHDYETNDPNLKNCICGAPGVVLYHYDGGWWCRAHESIPAREFQKRDLPLTEGIKRFVEFHS